MQDSETSKQRQHARRDAMRQRRSQTKPGRPQNPPESGSTGTPAQTLIDSIFRAAPVGIGLVSDRVLMEANDRMCEIVGYSREELVGNSVRMLYPTDEDYEYVGREKYRQIEEHGIGTVETCWRRKDGTVIDVLLSSTPLDSTDLSQGVTFTALDITERKKNDEALRRSDEKHRETAQLLETLLNAIPDVIGVQDNQHRVLRYNAAGYDFLGLSHSDVQDKQCYELIGRVNPCSICATSLTYATKKPAHVEKYVEEMDRWLDVRAYPILDDNGQIVNVIEHLRDITDQKRAEQAIRKNEARYRAVVEDQTEFICRFNPDGRVTFVNDALCRFFNHSRDELIGKEFAGWMTQEDYQRVWAQLRELTPEHPVETHENHGLLSDGRGYWGHWTNRAIFDDAGRVIEYQAVGRDVTAHRQAEAKSRQLSSILKVTTDLVSIAAPDGTITYMNEAGRKMLGWPMEDPDKTRRIEEAHPDWAYARIRDEGVPIALRDGAWTGETAMLTVDGRETPVSQVITAHRSEDGTLEFLSTVIRDLSAQKQTETALRESETRFRELAEMLPQTVFETDAQGIVTFGNRAGAEAFGYARDELAGLDVFDLFAPEDRDRVRQAVRKRLTDEKVDNREYRALCKDGSTFPTRIYASAVLQDGRPVGLRGIAVDITEEKQAEEERQAHLWLLECMERINSVIREATDPERMLSEVIDTVYSIFQTDRVWLLYPCNPDAPSFRVPVERCRPEYPGANAMDLEVTMSPDHAQDMRDALSSEAPQIRTAGTEHPVTADTAARFGVQAQIFTAVYPKVGEPWLFGMHQCSHARTWTANERTLFKGIARRISDGLSSLLSLRQLRESETRFRELAELLPQTVFEVDTAGRFTFANQAALRTFGYDRAAFEQLTASRLFAPEERDRITENIAKLLRDEPADSREYQAMRKNGPTFPMLLYASPIVRNGRTVGLRGIGLDITEQKQAEQERQAHLWSLECMERINLVIRNATDPRQMMSAVMETVGSIFGCDRAWLLNPCDPDAPSFQVPVEYARPEYPGAFALNIEIPMEAGAAALCREILASGAPITHGADFAPPVYEELTKQFQVQSLMATAVYPKIGEPWAFGIHQCSHARVWTPQEQTLFAEIGHRIADGLSSLLSLRELRDSEERFRELAELLPQTVLEMDAEGRFTFANHLASETFGYPPDEIMGRHATDFIAPQDRDRIAENFQKKLRGEPFWDHEYTAQRKDGTTFPILAYSSAIIKDGQVVGLRSVVMDFTERQRAEQALQESKAKLESILESSPYAITVTNIEGTIVDCNQATLETHGFAAKDELLGCSAFDLISEPDRARAAENMQTTLTQGTIRDVEYTLLRHGNREFPAVLSASLMQDAAGEPIGFVAVTVDITERKRIAEALQQSELKFRSLVETSSDWIWEADAQMRYTYSSPKAKDLLGYEREEILGRTPMDFMPPEEAERISGVVKACRKGSIPISGLVNRNIRRDGTEVVLETNGIPVFDAAGRFLGYRGIDRDITERIRAEQAVRESERRYRELYEGSRDASASVTMDGRILDCNSAYLEMLGYSKEELCRMRYQDITPAQWHESERKILDEQVMTRGYTDIYEKEYRRKDGTIFPIELRAYLNRDRNGRPIGMWALVRDITDRKQAEQALRESERTLMTLMGNLPGIAYRCRNVPNWTMEFMSEGCLSLTGYPPTELTGEQCRPYSSLIRPDERAYVWEQIQRSLKEKTRFELEYRITTRGGQEKWVWERGIGIYQDNGEIIALEGFISDIDERKKAEGRLLAYQKKLKSLASELALAEERERRRLAADLHDHACQSLALSKMKLQSLLQKADSTETPMLQSICETLTETIESVRGLTFDLSSPTLYRFGLEAALEELLKDKLTGEHAIAYRFSDDEAPKPLAHDVLVLLYQSVRELLINIIKHSHADEVTLDITRRRDSIRLVLADNGVGFDVDEVLSFPSQRRSVGLFNTLERLDYIGGKLEIESRRGRGSRFTLVAPLETPTQVAKENGNGSEDSTR